MEMKADKRFIEYAKICAKECRHEAQLKNAEAGVWDSAASAMEQFVDQENKKAGIK